jgi:OOP family OmpA-OmpF porin
MKRFIPIFSFILFILSLGAEEVNFSFRYLPRFTMTERADYSKRVNGSYEGYVNREIRGIFTSREKEEGVFQVKGTWLRAEEIKKSGRLIALPLDRVEQADFLQTSLGQTRGQGDFPVLRSFPQFPPESLSPGDKWEAPMERIIFDPDSDLTAPLTLYCAYTYEGTDIYKSRPVHVIQAQYAMRNKGFDRNIAMIINDVQGSHKVTLMIDQETMSPILARDSFQETWFYRNGDRVEYKGFNLVFYEGITGMDRGGVLDSLAGIFGDGAVLASSSPDRGQSGEDSSGEDTLAEERTFPLQEDYNRELFDQDVTVYEREEGIALSLNNLHFVPDQAVILASDYPLLDTLAPLLNQTSKGTLLVKGYTADIGTMESQMILSQERAKVVVDELTARGVDADRFVYIGMGGSEPIGDNSTEEGRRLNRRVEIIIMED